MKIIAAFAGTGKTYLAKKYPNVCADIDMGQYRWIYDGDPALPYEQRKAMRVFRENPEFPSNYISAIENAAKTHDIVLVSFCPELEQHFQAIGTPFYYFMPKQSAWGVLEQRFQARNNAPRFFEVMRFKFDHDLAYPTDKHIRMEIGDDEFLEVALAREGFL